MILIIDIDEDIYNHIVVDSEYFAPRLVNAFKNGTPIPDNATVCDIDQIRAEIAEYKDDKAIHAEQNEMIDIMLDIIDKYTKGDKE